MYKIRDAILFIGSNLFLHDAFSPDPAYGLPRKVRLLS